MDDPLVEICKSQWPQLRELFRNNWPHGLEAHCLLDTHITYPGLNESGKLKIYCPKGNFMNGMVAVMDQEYYKVFVCPLNNDLNAIENALVATNVINWERNVTVPSVNIGVLACLRRVCTRRTVKIIFENRCLKHLLNRDSPLLEITSFPQDTYVGPLIPEHVNLVDRTWTFHDTYTHKLFENLMRNGLTYVLYSSVDHSPLAWIFVDESGAFTHLFCLEEHRRKGYAEYITKVATNDLLQKGKDILVYTLEDNLNPQKLFAKLGFNCIEYVWWVFIKNEKK